MATTKRFKNDIVNDRVESTKADTKNKVSADAGSKGTRFIPYVDKGTATAKTTETPTRYKNTVDQEITNTPKKVRGVNLPREIPALTPKAAAAPAETKLADKVANKVIQKAETKAPVVVKDVLKKVVTAAPSELDSYKSSNPALRKQFSDNSQLAKAVRNSDYGSDEDVARQASISEADKFFRDRGVNGLPAAMKKGGKITKKPAVKKAKGGVILKPQTAKPLKSLSSKSITQAAAGMKKAIKPSKPVAKAFAKGGLAMKTTKPKAVVEKNVIKAAMKVPKAKMAKAPPAAPLPKESDFKSKGGMIKSSKAINGVASRGKTRGASPKM